MNRLSSGLAAAAILAAAVTAAPASAQLANEYSPAKLLHMGKSSKGIAGSGTVIVQVQVNANGSHRVVRVIHTTNAGDNAAAMEIAQNSTYRPAHRGASAINAFYDFTLKFKGKTVSSGASSSAKSGVEATIDNMIRAGNYNGAKARAEAVLASEPSNATVAQELGAANYFLNDTSGAAAAFAKADTITAEFKQVAANAFMQASVKLANSDPSAALTYAQRAVALLPNSGSAYYALGSAELSSGNATQAVTDLKKSHDLVFADPKADVKSRVNVDSELYAAYVKAGDSAGAAATAAQIKQLDPNNSTLSTLQANSSISEGLAYEKAGKYDDALAAYEKAAASSNPDAQVTGNVHAAFALAAKLGQSGSKASASDYVRMQGYADKALAIRPNDPAANYAEGIAYTGQYQLGGRSDSTLKSKAVAALDKAKSLAQAANMAQLAAQIDTFVKSSNIK